MIEARSHLIRLSAGRIRVLRFVGDGVFGWPLRYEVAPDQAWCRRCGCTDRYGCMGGCQWWDSARRLCTRCARRIGR